MGPVQPGAGVLRVPTGCLALPPSKRPNARIDPPSLAREAQDLPEFRWINTVLGNLKTSLSGSYHAFAFESTQAQYLARGLSIQPPVRSQHATRAMIVATRQLWAAYPAGIRSAEVRC